MPVEKKYSRQREAIAADVASRKDHPCADDVYQSTRKLFPNISLGTVYRNLSLLSDMGLITTLETLDKSIHYDGNTDSHSHFICERCSKIIDLGVERGLPEDISELGLLVRHKKIIYYGLCPDCQQNTAEDDDAGVLQ